MKSFIAVFTILSLSILLFLNFSPERSTTIPESTTQNLAFVDVNVIPMTEEGLILENQTVIINSGMIIEVRPTEEKDFKDGQFNTQIIATGKYLMPGLAEMHGHIPPTHPTQNMPDYFNEDYVESTLFLYVAAGVTTVRGMLGYDRQLELKDKVTTAGNREYIGPTLFLAGPSFNGNTVSSPEQAAERVRDHKEAGWDLLKIHPGLTLAEYNSVAETAHDIEIPFGGHVPADVGIERALEVRQETIDHVDGYVSYLNQFEDSEQDQKMAEIIQKTIDNDVWIVPTMALWETIIGAADYEAMAAYDELKYIPPAVRQNYNNWAQNNVINNPDMNRDEAMEHAELRTKLLGRMNEAGVKILMGTDAPQLFSVPGFSIHRELQEMKKAGMSNYEILETGTSNLKVYLENYGDPDIGTIETGSSAQILIANANPLEDLENLRSLYGVMSNGRWYSADFIKERLAEIEQRYSNN